MASLADDPQLAGDGGAGVLACQCDTPLGPVRAVVQPLELGEDEFDPFLQPEETSQSVLHLQLGEEGDDVVVLSPALVQLLRDVDPANSTAAETRLRLPATELHDALVALDLLNVTLFNMDSYAEEEIRSPKYEGRVTEVRAICVAMESDSIAEPIEFFSKVGDENSPVANRSAAGTAGEPADVVREQLRELFPEYAEAALREAADRYLEQVRELSSRCAQVLDGRLRELGAASPYKLPAALLRNTAFSVDFMLTQDADGHPVPRIVDVNIGFAYEGFRTVDWMGAHLTDELMADVRAQDREALWHTLADESSYPDFRDRATR